MTRGMKIRSATSGDAPALGRVMVASWLSAHRGHMPDAAWQKREAEWTPDVSARGWARTLLARANRSAPSDVLLVAEDDSGDLTALAYVIPLRTIPLVPSRHSALSMFHQISATKASEPRSSRLSRRRGPTWASLRSASMSSRPICLLGRSTKRWADSSSALGPLTKRVTSFRSPSTNGLTSLPWSATRSRIPRPRRVDARSSGLKGLVPLAAVRRVTLSARRARHPIPDPQAGESRR